MSKDTKELISQGLEIISLEISKIAKASQAEDHLDPSQARILTEYVKTLVSVDKNTNKPEEEEPLSDEELLEKAKEAINKLKGE